MTQIHLTRGLPASGKTTFAKAWVAESPSTRIRLNRDDIRAMVHTNYAGYDTERLTSVVQHNAAHGLLRKGIDLIIDDTNLSAKFVKEWLKLAERQGAEIVWHDEFLQVPLSECIVRDSARGASGRLVGADVITKMHMRYLNAGPLARPELTETTEQAKPYTGTPGKPKAVLVDIDGTLALNYGGRSPYDWSRVHEDTVNQPVADLVFSLQHVGYEVILMSGRDSVCRLDTEDWLMTSGIEYDDLFMRPLDDNRKDSVVKLELFDAHVRDNYDVHYVIDDRNQVVAAWRSIGLTVLQVADGDF